MNRVADAYNDFILNEDSQLSPLLKKKRREFFSTRKWGTPQLSYSLASRVGRAPAL
jgi:hypothetical protein